MNVLEVGMYIVFCTYRDDSLPLSLEAMSESISIWE